MAAKKAQPKKTHAAAVNWRNRIVETGQADPKKIAGHPLNWRVHSEFQLKALTGALGEVGWLQSVTINRKTGRLLDGHARVALACRDNQPLVPVSYVDLDEREEAIALASLDSIGALADTDQGKLKDVLGLADTLDVGLSELFSGLHDEALMSTFVDVGEDAGGNGGGGSEPTKLGTHTGQLRPVIAIPDVAILERAIKRTGKRNRGEAVIEICRVYLSQDEAGELDLQGEGEPADLSASGIN